MTVAVTCVQSAISLEAETPAFFFSAWSKHVLTASHSILKHPQLGADEDIKKTHPKHLHQATEEFYCYLQIYLAAALSLLFLWLDDTRAHDNTAPMMKSTPLPGPTFASFFTLCLFKNPLESQLTSLEIKKEPEFRLTFISTAFDSMKI